jgi:hypothetical protein
LHEQQLGSQVGQSALSSVSPGADQISRGTWGTDADNIYNGKQYLPVRFQDDGNYYAADLDDGRHNANFTVTATGTGAEAFRPTCRR